MVKSLFVVCGILSVCAISVGAAPFQEENLHPQKNQQPPAHAKDFDWKKKYDVSLETEPERRNWARQFNALTPLAEKMDEFVRVERIDAMSFKRLQVKQLEIRCKLETNPQDKKKCLEILVSHLNQLQELYGFLLEEPARPGGIGGAQISQRAFDDLVDYTLKTIEWESELEQVNEKLAAESKR